MMSCSQECWAEHLTTTRGIGGVVDASSAEGTGQILWRLRIEATLFPLWVTETMGGGMIGGGGMTLLLSAESIV
jgi:hypothetical protein